MFNQRSNPLYQKLRELIATGELGEISRITWIITNWFRSHAYYALGGWRATWKGEGGGVLINQCPHNLDLIQWITGLMPNRITAVGFVGKTHPIEGGGCRFPPSLNILTGVYRTLHHHHRRGSRHQPAGNLRHPRQNHCRK